jgi:hypothetical protein
VSWRVAPALFIDGKFTRDYPPCRAETPPFFQKLTAEAPQQAARNTDKIAGEFECETGALTLPPSSINTLDRALTSQALNPLFRDEFAADCPLQRRVRKLSVPLRHDAPFDCGGRALAMFYHTVVLESGDVVIAMPRAGLIAYRQWPPTSLAARST